MRSVAAFIFVFGAVFAADGPPTQAEQDEIWRKAMEERARVPAAKPASDRQKTAAVPITAPPPSPPITPPSMAAEPESQCGGASACMIGGAIILVAAVLASMSTSRHRQGLMVEGWLCETPLHMPKRLTTPLGGRVSVLTVRLDIWFTVDGSGFVITKAELAVSSLNVIATNTGEGWTASAGQIAASDLLQLAVAEYGRQDGRLRKAMVAATNAAIGNNKPPGGA